MSTMTSIQEAIEKVATEKLNKDIEALDKDLRDLLQKHHVSHNISIKIMAEDGTSAYPFLSQIFMVESVVEKIKRAHLPRYIQSEIAAILNKPK